MTIYLKLFQLLCLDLVQICPFVLHTNLFFYCGFYSFFTLIIIKIYLFYNHFQIILLPLVLGELTSLSIEYANYTSIINVFLQFIYLYRELLCAPFPLYRSVRVCKCRQKLVSCFFFQCGAWWFHILYSFLLYLFLNTLISYPGTPPNQSTVISNPFAEGSLWCIIGTFVFLAHSPRWVTLLLNSQEVEKRFHFPSHDLNSFWFCARGFIPAPYLS